MGVCGLIFDRRGHKCRELRCFRRYRGASRRARSVSQLAERFVVEMPVRIVVAVSGKHNDALQQSFAPLAKDGVVAEAKDKEAETGDAAANAASQASADNKTAGRRDAKDATDQKPSVTSVIDPA
jgi:hypothetical protein